MSDERGAALERFRPLRIWRSLDKDRKLKAATAFWKSESVKEEDRAVAVAEIAKAVRFRPQSILIAPAAKRAAWLAGLGAMSNHLASALLFAYHLETQVPILSRFLDLLGVPHENGRITGETKAPERKTLEEAVETILREFDSRDVTLYLETLVSQDDEAWGALVEILDARAAGRT